MNSELRTIVRGAYDIQKLRIQMGNRIVGNFKSKLGQAPGQKEDELDAEGKMILNRLRVSYKKLTDGVKTVKQKGFKGDELISSYTEFSLLTQYLDLEASEDKHFKMLGNILKDYPVFTEFLDGVKGIGPAMAGVIISEFDIHRAAYPSSMWKYAGLDVAQDGKGRSRKSEHLVQVTYTNKDGEESQRNGITFNPFIKTKLMGVLASSFLRAGESKYRTIYDNYKHRLENHPNWQDKVTTNDKGKEKVVSEKGHRHNAALRYMVKMFLVDLYNAWRTIEGLPVAPTYQEAKLGHRHNQMREAA